MLYFKHILRMINAFFEKGVFVSPKTSPFYNSKIISCRKLKFSPMGFGYKITPYPIFIQIRDAVVKKIFCCGDLS